MQLNNVNFDMSQHATKLCYMQVATRVKHMARIQWPFNRFHISLHDLVTVINMLHDILHASSYIRKFINSDFFFKKSKIYCITLLQPKIALKFFYLLQIYGFTITHKVAKGSKGNKGWQVRQEEEENEKQLTQ